jgi:hypothetical protein
LSFFTLFKAQMKSKSVYLSNVIINAVRKVNFDVKCLRKLTYFQRGKLIGYQNNTLAKIDKRIWRVKRLQELLNKNYLRWDDTKRRNFNLEKLTIHMEVDEDSVSLMDISLNSNEYMDLDTHH